MCDDLECIKRLQTLYHKRVFAYIDQKILSYVLGKHDVNDDYGFHGHVFHKDSIRPHEQLNYPTKVELRLTDRYRMIKQINIHYFSEKLYHNNHEQLKFK